LAALSAIGSGRGAIAPRLPGPSEAFLARLRRREDAEDYQKLGEDYHSPSCRALYLSAIVELRHDQMTEFYRADETKTMAAGKPSGSLVRRSNGKQYTYVVQ
jgi:hypothetical protein